MRKILITGMFRSGTTLLSKLLTFHPNILLGADAYLYFFRHFRNYWYQRETAQTWNENAPFSDNFFNPNFDALRAIADGDLSEPIPPELALKMGSEIDSTTQRLHPVLADRIPQVEAETFREYFQELLNLLRDVYGHRKPEVSLLGIKMSWLEDFVPAMARSFPGMKFVLLIRDIRAVVASQNKTGVTRPLLFYVRYWRKLVAKAYEYTRPAGFLKDRVYLLKYENLVSAPSREMEKLCRFLDVNYLPSMLELEKNIDEKGLHWSANTSYEKNDGIFTTSIDAWKKYLTRYEAQCLELLCGREMKLMGYEPVYPQVDFEDLLLNAPEPRYDSLADWLKDQEESIYLRNRSRYLVEVSKELLRLRLLDSENTSIIEDEDLIERIFFSTTAYSYLRNASPIQPETARRLN